MGVNESTQEVRGKKRGGSAKKSGDQGRAKKTGFREKSGKEDPGVPKEK